MGCWESFFRGRASLALSERVYEASELGGRTENSLGGPVRVFSVHGVLGAVFSRSSFSSPLRTRVRGFKFGWPGEERPRHAPLPGLFSIFSRDWRASWEPASVRTAFFRKRAVRIFSRRFERQEARLASRRPHARTRAYVRPPASGRASLPNRPPLLAIQPRKQAPFRYFYPARCGPLPCVVWTFALRSVMHYGHFIGC